MLLFLVLTGCQYTKGDRYNPLQEGDSLQYLVLDHGSGEKLSKKVAAMKLHHEYKGNNCTVHYLTDSVNLAGQRAVLLFHAAVPNMDNDILTKGFIGSFTSRQDVIYLLVSYQDFDQHFTEVTE